MELMRKDPQAGYALVAVMVILAAGLIIGIGAISRSVTDIKISSETEEAARAFSAAEAGIEEALRQDLASWSGGPIPVGDLTAEVAVRAVNSFAAEVKQDEAAEINLEGFSGNIRVYLDSGEALAVALLTNTSVNRWAIKTAAAGCGENFSVTNNLLVAVPAGAGNKILRLRPLCADAEIRVEAVGASLPAQSYLIRSEAEAEAGGSRVVEVTKTNPVLPEIFDYVLFSNGNLVK